MQTTKSTTSSDLHSRSRLRRLNQQALRWAERGFAIFGVLTAIYFVTFDLSVVVSPSMAPTLQGTKADNGDRVLTEKISYWFRQPRRWEVITFLNKEGNRVMKRVAGLPGEEVLLSEDGQLLIDGKPVDIPKAVNRKFLRYGNFHSVTPIPCGNGYYVLGDDSRDSDDSRFNGPVEPTLVLGRAWLIVWPRARVTFVN